MSQYRSSRGGESNKIFIGGITPTTTEDDLREHFGQFGEITDAVVMKDGVTKRSRGFGFVSFADPASVDTVQNSRPHIVDGKTVDSKRAVPKEVQNNTEEAHITVSKVFVGGVKDETDEDTLQSYFEQFGKISKVEKIMDKTTGKPRGFCFITFEDFDGADKCVLNSEHNIDGKRCEVKKAISRDEMDRIKGNRAMRGGGDYGRGGGYMMGGRGGYSAAAAAYGAYGAAAARGYGGAAGRDYYGTDPYASSGATNSAYAGYAAPASGYDDYSGHRGGDPYGGYDPYAGYGGYGAAAAQGNGFGQDYGDSYGGGAMRGGAASYSARDGAAPYSQGYGASDGYGGSYGRR